METKPPPWHEVSNRVSDNGLLELNGTYFDCLLNKNGIDTVYAVEQSPFARGKFASVRKATHRETGRHYAAKVIRRRRRVQDLRSEIYHEVAVLAIASHSSQERIVRLKEVFETPLEITLVLELAEGGELQRVIDEEEKIAEAGAIRLLRQIIQGLNFLHSKNVAHLDVKPQNLLLTSAYPNCDVKLCDFGLSRVVAGIGIEVREILGTPDYTAPEVLSYEPITLATDIWSVGVLAYVLLTGCSPFGGDNKQETFCNIGQGKLDFPEELFDGISEHAIDFIKKTVHIDPRERLTAFGCLEHSWLSEGIPRSLPKVPENPVPIDVTCDGKNNLTSDADTVHPIQERTSDISPKETEHAQTDVNTSAEITDSVLSDDGVDSGIETLSNGSDNATAGRCDLKLNIPESTIGTGDSVQRMSTGRVNKLVNMFESVGHAARRPNGEMGKENLTSPPPPAKRRELKS